MMTNNMDSLKIFAKKGKCADIVEKYNCFGWKLSEKSENDRYEDIVDLTFARPHKIENKDELQLFQVYMEDDLNAIAKLERNKHAMATAFGLFFFPVALILIGFGILFCLNILPVLGLIGGICFCAVGVIIAAVAGILLPKIIKKEKTKFEQSHGKLNKQLEGICEKAKGLTGGGYAKD